MSPPGDGGLEGDVASKLYGEYENHEYDNGGKNDWHYVTLSMSPSGTGITWTNRAGVSWTLTPGSTPGDGVGSDLGVKADCPYFHEDYATARVDWDQHGRVVRVMGPGGEWYDRVDMEELGDDRGGMSMGTEITWTRIRKSTDRLQGSWDDGRGGVTVTGSEGRFVDDPDNVHELSDNEDGTLSVRGFTLTKLVGAVATWSGMGMEITWTRVEQPTDRLQGSWDDGRGGVTISGSEGRFVDDPDIVHEITDSDGTLCVRGFTLTEVIPEQALWSGMGMEVKWNRKTY